MEEEYVHELIRRLNIVPDPPPWHLENWPWPIKVFTLGRFELIKEGKPIRFSRKVQQKPLSMLKALIMAILGLFLGTIGFDPITGKQRFTYQNPDLMEGISMVPIAMGMFGISLFSDCCLRSSFSCIRVTRSGCSVLIPAHHGNNHCI
jgi:hypothetical protein